MKFNEHNIKKIIQSGDENIWDDSDLSWFDHAFLSRLENQQLEPELRQDVLKMIAHDPNVFTHYMQLKKSVQTQPLQKSHRPFWMRFSFASVSLLVLVMASVIVIGYQQIYWGQDDTLVRSTGVLTSSPEDRARLDSIPDTFIAQTEETPVRIEIMNASNEKMWSSNLQKSPRFIVPVRAKASFSPGEYRWSVYAQDNHLVQTYVFWITGE